MLSNVTETHRRGNNNTERRKTVVNSYSDYDGDGTEEASGPVTATSQTVRDQDK